MMQNMYTAMGISPEVYEYGEQTLVSLKDRFDEIDKTAEYNQLKVLKAMQDCRVSEACLLGTTGYGYNDIGRDTLEAVYASLFHTEAALETNCYPPLESLMTPSKRLSASGNPVVP